MTNKGSFAYLRLPNAPYEVKVRAPAQCTYISLTLTRQTLGIIRALRLRRRAFISFSVFGTLGERLALVSELKTRSGH